MTITRRVVCGCVLSPHGASIRARGPEPAGCELAATAKTARGGAAGQHQKANTVGRRETDQLSPDAEPALRLLRAAGQRHGDRSSERALGERSGVGSH